MACFPYEEGVSRLQYDQIHKPNRSFLLVEGLTCLPQLEESSGYMEAAFPLSAFDLQADFSPAVEIAPPLSLVLFIPKMAPSIVVKLLEPVEAVLPACRFVSLEESDHAFYMDPPQLLVPL